MTSPESAAAGAAGGLIYQGAAPRLLPAGQYASITEQRRGWLDAVRKRAAPDVNAKKKRAREAVGQADRVRKRTESAEQSKAKRPRQWRTSDGAE